MLPSEGVDRASTWPFTGRDVEFYTARAALDRDRVVVVAGAAGLGKSRLARELVDRVAENGAVGVVCASASSRDIPLGAFARWLSTLPGFDLGTESDPLVTALVRAGAAVRAIGPRSVLLVDDAHMLDGVSATLIHQLVQDRALRLVLTVRTGEACPQAVTAIWKEGLATRVELEPLGSDPVRKLLEVVLGATVDTTTLRRLHDSTRGNVLWLRHLVESEQAAGRLTVVDGRWTWRGVPSLSAALEQLITDRIGTLDEAERHVLDLVALGEPVGLRMLVGLVPDSDIERVVDRGLVAVTSDGARTDVRLAHPLYGEVTRSRLNLLRARRLRGELSRALRDTGGRRVGDDLRRAVLDLDSDNPPSPSLLLMAAQQAIDLTDLTLAERLLRAAIDAGGGFDARLGLGFLLSWVVRPEEAEHQLAVAADEAVTDRERARAVLARAHLLILVLDRGADGRDLLARDGVDASGVPYAETDAMHAFLQVAGCDVVDGIATATAVLERQDVSALASAWACWCASQGAVMRGGVDGSALRDLVVRGMDAARRTPETGPLLGNLGFAEIVQAGFSGTVLPARARLAWADELPGPWGATWSALYRGRLALDAGQLATAARLLDEFLPAFPGGGGGWSVLVHAMIAQARAGLGDTVGAAASLEAAEAVRHRDIRLPDFEVVLARAWLEAARGAVGVARCIARELADEVSSDGRRAVEVLARHAALRLGDREQSEPLADLARVLGTPRAQVAAAHARGWANRDPEALLAASDLSTEHGMVLAAADAAAHAAVIAREQGRVVLASSAARRAAALAADRCEGAITPALLSAQDQPAVRGREREVAVLVAEGLTNREIAARLQVSIRTVDSHIYRACSRLGLPDRGALADVVLPGRQRGHAG